MLGNDDAIRSCSLVVGTIGEAIEASATAWREAEAKRRAEEEERRRKEAEEKAKREAEEKAKREAMHQFRAEYAQMRGGWAGDPVRWRGYDRWVERANNAFFGTQAAYDELVPGFEALFRREGGDWLRFYDATKRLADLPKSRRHEILKELAGA